ncbi:MAG: class I SAM-dependent methyltransferase [Gemmatales bacterium]|nr:class I SAM-dependent methyltransferase [Gemmatales bacterium]MDW8174329.1 class I SAM-dependent methyltransferase [Gemmatales bacterium]
MHPRTPEDWQRRYETGDTPWDTGRPDEELIRILDEKWFGPCRCVEIGCGTGTNAIWLAQRGFDVTAFDISPLAIEKARAKAEALGVSVRFLVGDVFDPPDCGAPFPLVFDRGVYHSIRDQGVDRFITGLKRLTAPGSWYLALMGNADDPNPIEKGPPRVSARTIAEELELHFEIWQLRRYQFRAVHPDGQIFHPLAWSGLFRRRSER